MKTKGTKNQPYIYIEGVYNEEIGLLLPLRHYLPSRIGFLDNLPITKVENALQVDAPLLDTKKYYALALGVKLLRLRAHSICKLITNSSNHANTLLASLR